MRKVMVKLYPVDGPPQNHYADRVALTTGEARSIAPVDVAQGQTVLVVNTDRVVAIELSGYEEQIASGDV